MRYCIIPVTIFKQNCSLVWCEKTGDAVLVDPGGESQKIKQKIFKLGITIKKILLTHGHIDHVGAAIELSILYNVPIIGPHQDDKIFLENLPEQCEVFGVEKISPFTPKTWLIGGEIIKFGLVELNVIHCPGHSPGHVIFWDKNERFILMGDVLFRGSIGHTDLPGGNINTLFCSIKKQLLPLSDDIIFLPGHGPTSTIGYERQNNLFLQNII